MGAFELGNKDRCKEVDHHGHGHNHEHNNHNSWYVDKNKNNDHIIHNHDHQGININTNLSPHRLREESLIVSKIYDSCRRQDCLTMSHLGPARAAESIVIGNFSINEGDIINPPHDAASVSIDKLKVKKVMIVDKEHNSFKRGYWDIEIKFVFEYRLIFREADGCIIGSIKALSIHNKKLTLFGSEGADFFMASDMYQCHGDKVLGNEPYVHIEAKGMSLGAEIVYNHHKACNSSKEGHHHHHHLKEVSVTIGLFSIVKLFRIVDLMVESRGFAIPKECENSGTIKPCDFFDQLSFPMDVFAPPQKPEFFAGISGDIPPSHHNQHHNHHHNNKHDGHYAHETSNKDHHHKSHEKKDENCCK